MKRLIPTFVLIALVIVVQLVVSAADMSYYLTQLTMTAYTVLVVLGLCLLMGYAGQISLGHAAFFAIGGYTAAVLTTVNLVGLRQNPAVGLLSALKLTVATTDLYGQPVLHLSPWISLVAAITLGAVVALLIGVPVLRLKGHYLAMATLGFGSIVYCVVLATPVLGQADGIADVPVFSLLPGLTIGGHQRLRVSNYYFAWALVIGFMVLLANLVRSRPGRALRAIHGNQEAAEAMGVDTARMKLAVFVLSAVVAAVAGVFAVHYNGGVSPADAGVMKSVRYVAIVAVGGMANIWGALLCGLCLTFLSLRGLFGSYDDAVFGMILVAIMLWAPEGVFSRRGAARIIAYVRSRRRRGTA